MSARRRRTRFALFCASLADATLLAINRDGLRLGKGDSRVYRSPLDCIYTQLGWVTVEDLAEDWGLTRMQAQSFLTGWHAAPWPVLRPPGRDLMRFHALGAAYRERFITSAGPAAPRAP